MSTFVLVHGAWHGGWCWDRVAPRLVAAGHRVTTPTLTGLGERKHLAGAAVDLDVHVADIVNHIDFEGLSDIVLVAHSYAAFVAYGVAEQRAAAITRLVLLDGFVARDGETMADHLGERGPQYREAAAADPAYLMPAPPPAALGVTTADDLEWVRLRLTAQPVGTYLQPIALTGAVERITDRSYISCTTPALPVLEESRRRIADAGWPIDELACGHDAMVAAPAALAALLLR
jgi:pimeloyl-ACP methyl ester carboxylesterase